MNRKLTLMDIPSSLTRKLIEEYMALKRSYSTGDWTPGQLNGGRFAEVALRIFQHLIGNSITSLSKQVKQKDNLLNKMKNDPNLDKHLRQKVTPLVELLLRFRNNRDAAHINGFDAKQMDTQFVMSAATWVLCEFIRVYSERDMEEAQAIVDDLSVKTYPTLISLEGETYIARHDLSAKKEVLVLLYQSSRSQNVLFEKTKDSNSSRFNETLSDLESDKFIGKNDGGYFIMPRGKHWVENEGMLDYKF